MGIEISTAVAAFIRAAIDEMHGLTLLPGTGIFNPGALNCDKQRIMPLSRNDWRDCYSTKAAGGPLGSIIGEILVPGLAAAATTKVY